MHVFRFGILSALAALLSLSTPCLADDTAAAEALFRSAREAADQGDWVTACDRFEESKRLEAAPGTVLNLARCREKLGQVASAWKSYEEAAQRLPGGDQRAAFARKKARELQPRVPKLTLYAPETAEDLTVVVRDTELSSATFGVPLPFDPGDMTVIVSAPGHEDSIVELSIEEGEELEHQLELGALLGEGTPAPAAATSSGPIDVEPTSSRKKTGAVFLGIGGVGLVTAVAGGIWAAVELPTVKDEENCIDDVCNAKGAAAADRGKIAVVMLGAGSALAVIGGSVGAYLTLSSGKESKVAVQPMSGGALLSWKTSL